MKTEFISAYVEPKIKKEFKKVVESYGLTMSEVINRWVTMVAETNEFPFEINIPIDTLGDTDIDYSDSPPLDDSFFEQVLVTLPNKNMDETSYLLRSKANAQNLRESIKQYDDGKYPRKNIMED